MPEADAVRRVDDGAVEDLAQSYLRLCGWDAHRALAAVVRDALAEVDERHGRLDDMIRFVSRGYVRGRA